MAKRCGLSQTAVSRIWRAFALQPHRVKTFKLSKDPVCRSEIGFAVAGLTFRNAVATLLENPGQKATSGRPKDLFAIGMVAKMRLFEAV